MNIESINWQPVNLEDNLIKLIPLTELDFERLFEVASDPLIWEQHPSSNRYQKEIFQQYFDGAILSKAAFLIVDKQTEKIIGSTRYYDYKPEFSSIAIGYTFLARDFWGGKFNKASKKLLLDYAFQYVSDVYFHIWTNNFRSQKAILKIGAAKIGDVDFDYYGKKLLHYEYLVKRDDYKI